MGRLATSVLIGAWAAIFLASCAPLTSQQTSLDLQHHPLDCSRFESIFASSQLADNTNGRTGDPFLIRRPRPLRLSAATAAAQNNFAVEGNARAFDMGEDVENILILSGGGQWGAYGSGFLNGLYGSGRTAPAGGLRLGDFNRITGISTGGIMATYVWAAIIDDRDHPRGGQNRWLDQLHAIYNYSDKDLFVQKSPKLGYLVFSNGLFDPAGLLTAKVESGAKDAWPTLRSDQHTRVSVGSSNVFDGQFHTFDLVKMVEEPQEKSLACYREAILASAAIPLAFPPRFINGQPFYDGGIQFLVYLDNLVDWMSARSRPPSEVNIRMIVNGNQSPNDPGDSVDQANDCDHVKVGVRPNCAAVSNNLLGIVRGPGKGLIPRVAQDIMIYQLKKDSVYRVYNDWLNMIRDSNGQIHGSFRLTYIPNWQLKNPSLVGGDVKPCQKPAGSTLQFDRTFETCLYDIGFVKGRADTWDYTSPPIAH